MTVDLYTIQVVRDADVRHSYALESTWPALMAEMEENLTDLLPPGYRARIRRWDDNTNEGSEPQ